MASKHTLRPFICVSHWILRVEGGRTARWHAPVIRLLRSRPVTAFEQWNPLPIPNMFPVRMDV